MFVGVQLRWRSLAMGKFAATLPEGSNSPTRLKAHFRPLLAKWGLDEGKLELLDDLLVNWLAGPAGEDVAHFRQSHPRYRDALDEFVSCGIVDHGSDGRRYVPKFLAFCFLLANGNRTAVKLRAVMDRVRGLVKGYLREKPLIQQRPIAVVEQALESDQRPLLQPALYLMSAASMGVNLNGADTSDAMLAFSDQIFTFDSPTQAAWHFLQGHERSVGQRFIGHELLSVPFALPRLQLAPEAHASASKALANLETSPDSAVSHARAALEATFKHVLGPNHPTLLKPFPQQSAAFRELLHLHGEFAGLGTRIVAVMVAIGDIRNLFGDSHGRGEGQRGATRQEAQLTVGTAMLLCDFLLGRWEAVRSLPATGSATASDMDQRSRAA
jgi:hypothetical protein